NETVAAKLRAAVEAELTPIVCVGESLQQRQDRTHIDFTLGQLDESLAGCTADELDGLVIAYEPVWAIGTGATATAADAAEMATAIRARIGEEFGAGLAESARILYGGSVKTDNVAEIVASGGGDGALGGGASRSGRDVAGLCQAAVAR